MTEIYACDTDTNAYDTEQVLPISYVAMLFDYDPGPGAQTQMLKTMRLVRLARLLRLRKLMPVLRR